MHFLRAACRNDYKLMKAILSFVDTNAVQLILKHKNHAGESAVHLMATGGGTDDDFLIAMQVLIKYHATNDWINEVNDSGKTALHLTMESNTLTRSLILLEHSADAQIPVGETKQNLMHLVAVNEVMTDVVFKKIANMTCLLTNSILNARDRHGETPLLCVVKRKKYSWMKYLLDRYADPCISDDCGKNCLHYAFMDGAMGKIVQELLSARSGIALESMADADGKYPIHYIHEDTPMSAIMALRAYEDLYSRNDGEMFHLLQKSIDVGRHDILKYFLVKGVQMDMNTLAKAIDHFDDAVVKILVSFASPDNLKETLNVIIPPGSTLFRKLIIKWPDVAKEALNQCIGLTREEGMDQIAFDYQYFYGNTESDELDSIKRAEKIEDKYKMSDPLQLMLDYNRKDLLKHPVVASYIYENWRTSGFALYMLHLILFFLLVLLLSLYAVIVNHPLSDACHQHSISSLKKVEQCGSLSQIVTAYTCAAAVMLLAVFFMVWEIIWIKLKGWRHFTEVQTYIEWATYSTSILFVVFVFINECGCPKDWQWQIGIISVFLGWLNLIFLASNFPLISIYAIIFREIFITFTKLLFFALLLISAFSMVLYMMFHNPTPSARMYSFSNIGISFLSVMNMVTGGVGFEALFGFNVPPSAYVPIPYHVFNLFMWMVFLFSFLIIFKNMLISLAIGDMKTAKEKAELKKIEHQNKQFSEAKLIFWRWKNYGTSQVYPINMVESNPLKRACNWFQDQMLGEKSFLENIVNDFSAYKEIHGKEIEDVKMGSVTERIEQLYYLVEQTKTSLQEKIVGRTDDLHNLVKQMGEKLDVVIKRMQ